MNEINGFLGIRFGQSLEDAHGVMVSQGFKFVGRETAEAPIGRVLYFGTYMGKDAKAHLDFLRNEFHRTRLEIPVKDPEIISDFKKDLTRKFGPSERLTRSRQACSDDSPQEPCFEMWALDEDTSIILDVANTGHDPLVVIEYFRIL